MLLMPLHFLGLLMITVAILALLSWLARREREE
jgi:hypothetical protein